VGPMALATWFVGQPFGLLLAAFAALSNLWLNSYPRHLHGAILAWNALLECAVYAAFVALLGRLQKVLARERAARAVAVDAERAQGAFLGHKEPRVPPAAHRGDRHDGPAARPRPRRRAARLRGDRPPIGPGPAQHRERRPRLLQDRGRARGAGAHRLRPPR